MHIGGRCESPSVGRGVLCARRGKGIRCGSRLLAELSPASVGSLILPGKERSGVGQRESSTRARPPSKIGGRGLHTHRRSVARTRCRSFWRAVWSLAALKRGILTHSVSVGRETPGYASSRQSPNGGSRTPAKCALNSAVVRGEHVSARRPSASSVSVIVHTLPG